MREPKNTEHNALELETFIIFRGSMYRSQVVMKNFYSGDIADTSFNMTMKKEREAGLPFLDASGAIFEAANGEVITLPEISLWYDRGLYVRWHNSESFGPAPVVEYLSEGAKLIRGEKEYAFRYQPRKA